jgi:hypothetical protein
MPWFLLEAGFHFAVLVRPPLNSRGVTHDPLSILRWAIRLGRGDHSGFGIAALPGILHANVGSKLFVPLSFVLLLHLFQVFANERISGPKHPVTLGAPESLEGVTLNPYSLARHGRIISRSVAVFFDCNGNVNVSLAEPPSAFRTLSYAACASSVSDTTPSTRCQNWLTAVAGSGERCDIGYD